MSIIETCLEARPDGLVLFVRLSPGASRDAIMGVEADADGRHRLKVSVTAVPEKGKANAALAKLLAKKLRLPKTGFRLIAGDQSRQKTLLIEGDGTALLPLVKDRFAELGV